MCKFCDKLEWREYGVPLRSLSADDNFCQVMTAKFEKYGDEYVCLGANCADCGGCVENEFVLNTYDNRISFSFTHCIKEIYIGRHSEMFDINFCPWCGRRLSKELVDFEKCCLGEPLEETE